MTRLIQVSATILAILLPTLAYAETIEYEVRKVSRIGSRMIASGTREYKPSEIQIYPYERSGKQVSEKLLLLEQGFKVGARIFNDRELTGFGLIAQQSESDFSWEWFSKESGSQFTKLQGGQHVDVQTMPTPFGVELVQVRFLEDTTLRFKAGGAADDTHHILIKAGSVLRLR